MLKTFSFNKNMVDKLAIFQLIALILRNRDFIMSDSDCLIEIYSTIWTQKYIFIGFGTGKTSTNEWLLINTKKNRSGDNVMYDISISVTQHLTRKLLLLYFEHQRLYTIILCAYVVYSYSELAGACTMKEGGRDYTPNHGINESF